VYDSTLLCASEQTSFMIKMVRTICKLINRKYESIVHEFEREWESTNDSQIGKKNYSRKPEFRHWQWMAGFSSTSCHHHHVEFLTLQYNLNYNALHCIPCDVDWFEHGTYNFNVHDLNIHHDIGTIFMPKKCLAETCYYCHNNFMNRYMYNSPVQAPTTSVRVYDAE
jgi:hypothetical protein